jgi:cytoskeleton protein RodZ
MFEIGPSLRQARMGRGLTPQDVQKAIRIRDRYLNALEEEQWELLPGDAYAKGFLRTYADFLGLDGALYVDEFNAQFAHRHDPAFVLEAMAPSAPGRVGLLRPLVAIAAIVGVVAAVAAWQLHGSPSARQPPPATQPRPPTTATTPHLPAKKPRTATTTAAAPTSAVLLAAKGRVWLQIRAGGATGRVIYEGVLEQGASLPVSLSPRVWMRIGAPWNLEIRMGGRLVGGLPAQPANVILGPGGLSPAA